ncbi:MAG: antitoxin family protein [Nitrospinae bacterium]|nr:antitoxin family protein [Nitrospinota bacterium]
MSKVIDAVFEEGVFKPLQDIDVREHEKVAIKIISLDEWQNRFNRIIEKIHKKAAQYTPEEIESDITQAIKEVRKERDAH